MPMPQRARNSPVSNPEKVNGLESVTSGNGSTDESKFLRNTREVYNLAA